MALRLPYRRCAEGGRRGTSPQTTGKTPAGVGDPGPWAPGAMIMDESPPAGGGGATLGCLAIVAHGFSPERTTPGLRAT